MTYPKCDHGIAFDRWCDDCDRIVITEVTTEVTIEEEEETPAENRRRWLSTFLLIIAFLMGLGALALAARLVFEWLGGAA